MNAITYYSEAIKKVDSGEITIGEYERMINVLRDVEPVVRCRDCTRWRKYNGEQFGDCEWTFRVTKAEGYCDDAERKDGEHDRG